MFLKKVILTAYNSTPPTKYIQLSVWFINQIYVMAGKKGAETVNNIFFLRNANKKTPICKWVANHHQQTIQSTTRNQKNNDNKSEKKMQRRLVTLIKVILSTLFIFSFYASHKMRWIFIAMTLFFCLKSHSANWHNWLRFSSILTVEWIFPFEMRIKLKKNFNLNFSPESHQGFIHSSFIFTATLWHGWWL